jgi:myo-inositol-1(or 4)-monophosphatase
MNTSADFWTVVLNTATTLSDRVGQELLAYFGQVTPQEKEDGSLITQADRWADGALREGLAAQFPDHGLLTEETLGAFPDREWCWVVDPLDGTTNFARKIPIWGISLGLLYRGWPVFGYVAIPPLGESFYGFYPGETGLEMPTGAFQIRGQGALGQGQETLGQETCLLPELGQETCPLPESPHSKLNTQNSTLTPTPLSVFQGELTKNHLFSFCTRSIHQLQVPPAAPPFPCKIRMLGVATYNLLTIASGLCIGGTEATPKVWDIAATWVICQAAGATWYSLKQTPFPLQAGEQYHSASYPCLVLANGAWQAQFLELLAG